MKNLICLILTLALLLAALGGCGEPAESGDLSTGGGSEERAEQDENSHPTPPRSLSVKEEIEYWAKYSQTCSVFVDFWVNDSCYCIILENNETKNLNFLFKNLETDEISGPFQFENDFLDCAGFHFYRDGYLYFLTNQDSFLKIDLATFDFSYEKTDVFKGRSSTDIFDCICVSLWGTVMEYSAPSAVYFYDILNPSEKVIINPMEFSRKRFIQNTNYKWSFDGEHICFVHYSTIDDPFGDPFHVNPYISVFDKEGNFVRTVRGNLAAFDKDSILLWFWTHDGGGYESYWAVYSLSDPTAKPITVTDYFSLRNSVWPVNGFYYYFRLPESETSNTLFKIDIFSGGANEYAVFDYPVFCAAHPSPNGKYLVLKETLSDDTGLNRSFFFKFVDI